MLVAAWFIKKCISLPTYLYSIIITLFSFDRTL